MDMTVDKEGRQGLLSRKEASERLKVSVRTVDRYVKSGKLSTVSKDGRIWLLEKDIMRFNDVDSVDTVDTDLSTPVYVDTVDKNMSTLDNSVNIVSTSKNKSSASAYKKLYFDLKDELREKQERLEIANYRVGQLETQVKNSIPLLEYHHENYQKKLQQEKLQNQLNEQNQLIENLKIKIRAISFNKRIFIIILLIILALQPLWLLYLNSSG